MMTPQDVLQTGTQRTIAPRTHPYSPYVPQSQCRRAKEREGVFGLTAGSVSAEQEWGMVFVSFCF